MWLEPRRFDIGGRTDVGAGLDPARVLDEHLLDEPVRFTHELVVVLLAHLTDALQLRIRERFPRLTERRERVLGLPRRHNVADETKEIAFAGSVRQVARDAHRLSERLFTHAGLGADLLLILLEHPLMLAHLWDRA